MTLQLRPYQQRMIDDTREAMRKHRRVLLQAPTGAGKTAITVYMMGMSAERGISSMFCVHQNELLKQTSAALWRQSLSHGVIAAGRTKSHLPAQVASVQTLVRRLDDYAEPGLIIIDETHRAAASTYLKILERYPNARVIGLTATPERTDGKGLGEIFDTIVLGPQIRELIDGGYLCDYELMAPPALVDMGGVRRKMGDFDTEESEARVDKPTITGDAVEHYRKHASGKRCVVMCITRKHAQHVCDAYNAAGIKAEFIHGECADGERDAMLKRFAAGETKVLCNVQLMIEGVDIPAIEVIQWLRPTQSLIVWMQGNGRGLRPAQGKTALLILDHVGNWNRPGFGMPDDPREWSLDGRKPRGRKQETESFDIRQCPACYNVYRATLAACPKCNAAAQKSQREIEIIAGELQRIETQKLRMQNRRELGKARTLEDLIAFGLRQGMKRPAEWAAIRAAARMGKQPSAADFAEAKRIHAAILLGKKQDLWDTEPKSPEETV